MVSYDYRCVSANTPPPLFLVGVCRPVIHILTLFQTKKCHFSHPFSDVASKIPTYFQTWTLRNYVIII